MWNILKRILFGLVIVVFSLFLFLAGSIIVDSLFGRERILQVSNTTIPGDEDSPPVRAYVAKPDGSGPFPAVIMIHEFYGLNDSIVGKAEGLAAEGYYVVAPDTFRGSTTEWIPRAIYQVITNRPAQVNQDLDVVYRWLAAQPVVDAGRIATLGFCYGGRAALGYSLRNPGLAATVVFYGSPVTDVEALKSLRGPVLGIFGGADNSIPVEEVQAFETALEAAGVRHEITIYPGQPHAFMRKMEEIRAGGAQGEAWAQMLAFLDANLKNRSGGNLPGKQISYTAPIRWGYYLRIAYEHALGTASGLHH